MREKHALIIGGSKGLGRETVEAYAREKWNVSSLSRGDCHLPVSPLVRTWRTDISNASEVKEAISQIVSTEGSPQAIVFCQRFRGLEDDWDGEINTSVSGVKHVIDALCESPQFTNCSVVLVSSVNANLITRKASLAYHVAKAAQVQMVRYYAVQLGHREVRFNSVSPGSFIKDSSREAYASNPKLQEMALKTIPLRRFCEAAEVVSAIMFLTSESASYITGQDIVIDGGAGALYPETLARELLDT